MRGLVVVIILALVLFIGFQEVLIDKYARINYSLIKLCKEE